MEPETAHAIASYVADNTAVGSTALPVSVDELEAEMDANEFYDASSMIYVDTVLDEQAECAIHKKIFDLLTHHALRVKSVGQLDPDNSRIETDQTVLRIWVEAHDAFSVEDLPVHHQP